MNLYFRRARQALCVGTRLLTQGKAATVGVPRFICSDVPKSLLADGFKVTYYEVTASLEPDFNYPAPTCDILLLVNYFGFAAPVSKVDRIWQFPRTRIIEDNAHGLFSCDLDGLSLGSRTAIGVTSFRKTLRVPDGGILHVNDPSFVASAFAYNLPPSQQKLDTGFRMRAAIYSLEKKTHLPLMNISRIIKRVVRPIRQGEGSADSNPQPVSHDSLAILQCHDSTREIARRRNLYFSTMNIVESSGGQLIFSALPDGVAPYCLPFIGPTSVAQLVQRRLFWRGREVFSWPDLPATNNTSVAWQQNVHLVSFL